MDALVDALVEIWCRDFVEGFGVSVGGGIWWRELLEEFGGGKRWTCWWRKWSDLVEASVEIWWRDYLVEGNDGGVGGGV